MNVAPQLLAAAVLIALNGLFVAAEFSLLAANRARLEGLAEQGHRRARIAVHSLQRLGFELSGAQLGITATSLALGIVAEPSIGALVEPVIEGVLGEGGATAASVFIALLIATAVQMVMGELVPKNLAIARPESVALWVAPIHGAYVSLASPLIRLFDSAANWTVRLAGVEPREELPSARTLEEFEMLIASSSEAGTLDDAAGTLLTRVIRFADKTAADALVGRTAVAFLTEDASLEDLVRLARETGHSRFPVAEGDLDHVLGFVHVRAANRVPPARRRDIPVRGDVTDALVVPETRPLDELMSEMRAGRHQMALVIDEYGGTAGIVTFEDLVEEIVGDIRDEYDEATPRLTQSRPGAYLMDGSLHRDEVTDVSGLVLPDGPFETLAGHLLVLFDRIPTVGDAVADDATGWRFEVVEMDRLRIALVRATAPEPAREVGS